MYNCILVGSFLISLYTFVYFVIHYYRDHQVKMETQEPKDHVDQLEILDLLENVEELDHQGQL